MIANVFMIIIGSTLAAHEPVHALVHFDNMEQCEEVKANLKEQASVFDRVVTSPINGATITIEMAAGCYTIERGKAYVLDPTLTKAGVFIANRN